MITDRRTLEMALVGYRQEVGKINAKIGEIEDQLRGRNAIELNAHGNARKPGGKRHISPEGRARIAAAQKKRWAAAKKAAQSAQKKRANAAA